MEDDLDCNIIEECTTQSAKKRKRERPNRKWSDEEVSKILQLLLEHKPFEMPSAQYYYKKIIDAAGMKVDWKLLRWKVKNMKSAYQKTLQWQNSTGVGLLDSDGVSSIDQKIGKMCPHYKTLHDIFGEKNARTDAVVFESVDLEESTSSSVPNAADDAIEIFDVPLLSPIPPAQTVSELPTTSANISAVNSKKAADFANKMKKAAPKSAVSRLTALQSERNDVHLKRLAFEKEKQKDDKELKEKEIKIKEEQLNIEKERQDRMLDIEERKLKMEEEARKEDLRLREMELAMKERIARYELELKYKH